MRRFAVVLFPALFACTSGEPFDGLARAEKGGGPQVLFDLTHKPLPEVPYPNDLAARPDSTSPTGLRVNAPLDAPTRLERDVRALLDTLDGFGTFAPITVAFDQDLDVQDLYARQNDGDAANDAVYVIDLSTGERVPLDFNGGHYPLALADPGQYFRNDPLSDVRNLVFPVSGPFANFLHPEQPHATARDQVDDLLTFYERETRTLIVRPVVPLAQQRKYAVVLTKRLHGADGRVVQSPHAGINHVAQNEELKNLPSLLPAGLGVSDVAYTWAFTTQSATRDLEVIREGLYARGPLRVLGLQYPLQASNAGTQTYGTLMNVLQERGAYDPDNPSIDPQNYILPVSALMPLLNDPTIKSLLLGNDQQQVDALLETYKYVDYFVSVTFESPSFLNVQTDAPPADQTFRLDVQNGTARTSPERITLTLAVPKERVELGHVAPFPTVIAGHGYKSMRLEHILGFAGSFAKFGLATVSIDAYGHGIGIDPFTEAAARGIASTYHLEAFAEAVFRGRARDLDFDGIKDSGGDFWTADTFHTRDVVRQSIVDWMQLVRLWKTFDGTGFMGIGNTVQLAGDFNGDGIPDVGGAALFPENVKVGQTVVFSKGERNPGSDLFVFGISLGGILSGILPAVEPSIVAAAPVSGAGGLADVGIRSTLDQVVQAVFLELLGPFVATCNFDPNAGDVDWQKSTATGTTVHYGACSSSGDPSLVLVVQDVNVERDIQIAKLSLHEGDRVMVRNLAQTSATCAGGEKIDGCSLGTVRPGGALRLPIAADWPLLRATRTPRIDAIEKVAVQVLQKGDPLEITVLPAGGGAPVVIDKFGVDTSFFGVPYAQGDALVSPARGFALSRNTPEFRRMIGLSQSILEPGDPVNYAPHWFKDTLPIRRVTKEPGLAGGPANVIVVGTVGDPGVPVHTAISMARAGGIVELSRPDPAYGLPVDQVLAKSGVVEGVANLNRFDDPRTGPRGDLSGHIRCDEPSACTGSVLADVTGYGCDAPGTTCTDRFNGLGAPRLNPPLREQLVVQSAPGGVACPTSPRSQLSFGCWSTGASACPTDALGKAQPGVSALMLPYLTREGQHGFRNPQPQKAFDIDTFMINVIGRYFECRGRTISFDACQSKLSSASPGGCAWIPPPP